MKHHTHKSPTSFAHHYILPRDSCSYIDTLPLETPYAAQDMTPQEPISGFTPLRIPLFRDRWIGSTVSNVGTWMQDTAGTWRMTSLTTSSLLIALMQTAASLPVLALGLPAGTEPPRISYQIYAS